jgi:hypothetical protein
VTEHLKLLLGRNSLGHTSERREDCIKVDASKAGLWELVVTFSILRFCVSSESLDHLDEYLILMEGPVLDNLLGS